MKVIRSEGWSNREAGLAIFGDYRVYCRVRRARRVTLLTALLVQRFVRTRIALPRHHLGHTPSVGGALRLKILRS